MGPVRAACDPQNAAITGSLAVAVLVLLVTPCVPGPHLEALLSLEHIIMYTLWWFGLGVASSVWLGTGAHTGTLFPVNEDVNLMTAVILFFVLLGTIGYWMCLRSKALSPEEKAKNEKALLQGAKDSDTHKVASLIKAGTDVGCKDGACNTVVELAQNAQTIDVLKGAGATMPEFPDQKKNDLLIEYAEKGATGGSLMALQTLSRLERM